MNTIDMKNILTHLLLLPAFILISNTVWAQIPTDQDCLGAIPVCEGFYTQMNSYTGSGNYPNEIPTSGSCPGNCMNSGEKNCVWYYVTVQSDGLMGFVITPNQNSDDYDWSVYNLTDKRCEDIYLQAAQLQVSCNWSGTSGSTGPNGGSNSNCQGAGGTPFNAMIPVQEGQNFVINISNFSSTQYGYTLDFSMSTADIYDDVPPVVEEIYADDVSGCSTTALSFTFSEKVWCDRVTPSSFGIEGPGGPYTVTDVYGVSCDVGGDWEKDYTIYVDPPFASNGSYTFQLFTSFPGITDACNNPAQAANIPFELNLGAPTINSLGLSISAATCGMANGSITGVSATGQTTLNYIWKNALGTVVGTSPELRNVPAGVYTLEVHDLQFCTTYGGPWEVEEFGAPEIDDHDIVITSSNYGASNGSISGIIVTTTFNIDEYIWTDDLGTVVGSELDLDGVASGYYGLEIIDENTCSAITGPYFVGEIGGPLSTYPGASPSSICAGDPTTLSTGAGGGSGDYTFSWTSTPAGFTSTLENPVVSPEVTTTYHLVLFDGYITAEGDVTVTVIPLPVPDAGIDQSIPHGIYTTLNGSATVGSGDYHYFWSPVEKLEDAAAQNPQTKNLYETTPFYLVVEDEQSGCISEDPDEVIVEVTGGFLTTNPSSFPDSVFCLGESFELHANGGGGSGIYTYTWTSEPPMTLPTDPDFSLTLNDPGTYFFYCLINDGYNENFGYVEVTVQPSPEVDLGAPVQTYCVYDTIILDAGNPGSEYLWSNGATTQYITVGTTGLGYDPQDFSVLVLNEEGCDGTDDVSIIFSYDACVGIAEIEKEAGLQVFPNPTSGLLNIFIEGANGEVQLRVMNTMGTSLGTYNFVPGTNGMIEESIDLSEQAAGIYFLQAEGDNIHHTLKVLLR